MKTTVDLRFENQFSIVLIRPLTVKGKEWIKEHLIVEPWQWCGGAVACEPRSAAEICIGAKSDGIRITAEDYHGEVEQV